MRQDRVFLFLRWILISTDVGYVHGVEDIGQTKEG